MLPLLAFVGGAIFIGWSNKETNRRTIDSKIRNLPREDWPVEIAKRDDWICGICGKKIVKLVDLEIDHIKPRSLGGEDEPPNLRPAHWRCNWEHFNNFILRDKIMKISRQY